MAVVHIWAKTARAAAHHVASKGRVVTRVNWLKTKGKRKGGLKCFAVTTRRRKGARAGHIKRPRHSRRRGSHASRSSAMKKAWRTRKRKFGKHGFSRKGWKKVRAALRRGRKY